MKTVQFQVLVLGLQDWTCALFQTLYEIFSGGVQNSVLIARKSISAALSILPPFGAISDLEKAYGNFKLREYFTSNSSEM